MPNATVKSKYWFTRKGNTVDGYRGLIMRGSEIVDVTSRLYPYGDQAERAAEKKVEDYPED